MFRGRETVPQVDPSGKVAVEFKAEPIKLKYIS